MLFISLECSALRPVKGLYMLEIISLNDMILSLLS